MKHATALSNGFRHPLRRLEDGTTRETIAEDCRSAALSFMSGVAVGWEKLDLAIWLIGPYARATRHANHAERVAALGTSSISGPAIDPGSVEDLVTRVRAQLLASLEKGALQLGILDFTNEVVARGSVRKIRDADGLDAWIPVDTARMRLRDRLRALFAADYLNAPHTYADLFVCHRCEAVVFDDHAKRRGICGIHRLSGTLPRNDGVDS